MKRFGPNLVIVLKKCIKESKIISTDIVTGSYFDEKTGTDKQKELYYLKSSTEDSSFYLPNLWKHACK